MFMTTNRLYRLSRSTLSLQYTSVPVDTFGVVLEGEIELSSSLNPDTKQLEVYRDSEKEHKEKLSNTMGDYKKVRDISQIRYTELYWRNTEE